MPVAEQASIWAALFDQVFVLSLKNAHERRNHIVQHLAEYGLNHYQFFDATPADSDDVGKAMASGEVLRFPPCFRCGELDCGDPNCNNFLIPAQVACNLSYRRLWRTIASGPAQRLLVLEDDVVLHKHTPAVLSWLAEQVATGMVPWQTGQACLLRLGWARCAEHDAPAPEACRIDSSIRMSNPCHALTRDFAQALLARDCGIHHTSDVYQHAQAPRPGEAFTVFPPIASEHSWSDGRFASSIHPKSQHVQHLLAIGDRDGAERESKRIRTHVRKKYFRPLLISGHPHGGTDHAAALCQQLGLDVGHEKLGHEGISSWMFAVEAEANPDAQDDGAHTRRALAWRHLLMVVRDPCTTAPLVMRDALQRTEAYTFRRDHILRRLGIDLDTLPNALEQAVWSISSWARILLAQHPALVMRMEDGEELLRDFLIAEGLLSDEARQLPLRPMSTMADLHTLPMPFLWQELSKPTRQELHWYAETFGYRLPQAIDPLEPSQVGVPMTDALEELFLTPSGWSRAKAEQAPVDAAGKPLPWFTYSGIELLTRMVRASDRVFEYGAGHSTLWWQEQVAEVVSVEHDEAWCELLRPRLSPTVDLCSRPYDHPASTSAHESVAPFFACPRRTAWPYDSEKVVRRGLDDEHFVAYATRLDEVDKEGQGFDIIVVDGMARRLCTWVALKHLRPDGLLIFDNSNRSDYDLAYTLLSEAGMHHIPLWGLVPGADFHTCTSVLTLSLTRFPRGGFLGNRFALPEY